MSKYDFATFLARVSELGWVEVLAEANAECGRVERESSGVRGAPKRRAEGSVAYTTKLKQLLFFLQSGTRPGGVEPSNFRLYEPLVRSLVAKRDLPDTALAHFVPSAP